MRAAGRTARALVGLLVAGLIVAFSASALASAASAGAGDERQKPWDGNRTTPAHFIPLRDEINQLIVPTDFNPMPFSARYTCGPCHDYKTVQGGWHFDAMKSEKNGRPGEPWIWLDSKTGTILPLSYRKWPGTWEPGILRLNPWDFTMLFGRHMPGGGPAEPGDEDVPGLDARWSVSGKAEVNCLACHNKTGRQDESEWAKQVLRQNLRWAATAAAGVGEVGGMASRLRETWDVYDGPNLDDHEWAVAPFVKYRTVDFDSKHRYFFDIAYPPDDRNCLACHSVSPVAEARAMAAVDVHTTKGIKCAECHRNDLGHGIFRGYEGEAADTSNRSADSFTCRGCHLGEDPGGTRLVVPGRLGAPYPKHTGIPLIHFRTLHCTVCHSGPVPDKSWARVRTSRANRLGIYGVAQWSTDQPAAIEPVFMRDGRGKIGPRRLVWPAFWARTEGRNIVPLQPGAVEAAAGGVLKCEERISAVLAALAQACGENETPVLAAGGWLFEVNVDGGLDATSMVAPEKGGAGNGALSFWGTKKDGALSPLVPDFDPAAPDKDPAVEPHIQSVLQALAMVAGAPGSPVVVVRKTLYRIAEGNLVAIEAPAGLGGAPGAGWLVANKVEPLAADFDVRTVAAKAGTEQTLTEEQVGLILKALTVGAAKGGKADVSIYAYFSGGRAFRLDRDGRLSSTNAGEAGGPVTWPLAHNVRPVQQSLGWNGCTDCHTADSKFFFKTARGTGPLLTKSVASRSAASFMGVGSIFHRVFGLTFVVRPFLKLLLAVTILATGAVLAIFFFVVAGKLAGLIEKGS
jgi:hypothetical protein